MFENINVTNAIILDQTATTNASISNTNIHILYGKIYNSLHLHQSYINVENVIITTNQTELVLSANQQALFHMELPDNTRFHRVTVLYKYDTSNK